MQEGRFDKLIFKTEGTGADGKAYWRGKHSDGLCRRIGRVRTRAWCIAGDTALGALAARFRGSGRKISRAAGFGSGGLRRGGGSGGSLAAGLGGAPAER